MRYAIISLLFVFMLLAACAQPAAKNNTTTAPTGDAVIQVPASTEMPVEKTEEKKAPAEDKPAIYTVEGTEGDLIQLKPEAVDPDGDKVVFSFTKPFDQNGRWQTVIGDEGRHNIIVGANDGKLTTTETVLVVVKRANRPPVIDCKDVVVNEGEQVDLHDRCTISDEDDQEVIVTYGGWMDSWRYTTTYDDAGVHTVTISASDKRKGQILHTITKDVQVTVRNVNRPPVFSDKFPSVISAVENDIVTLPKSMITDPDGDKVTITFGAPFNSEGTWKTKLGDAGTYDVDVVVSDGNATSKHTVKVKIGLLNTAPTLKLIPDITVKEGETVKLPIVATDREGDKLTVAITGWMTSDTKKTDYDSAGEYTTKVVVTDGEFETSQVVHIKVQDVNRPPVFVVPA